MRYLFGLMIFGVGMLVAMQPPINAALSRRSGPLWAAAVSFLVGTVALVLVSLLLADGSPADLRHAPLWQFTGGLLGAMFVFSTIVLVTHLGALGLIAAGIAGQLAGAVLIDRFGLFGLPQIPLTPLRAGGLVLLLLGVALILRR